VSSITILIAFTTSLNAAVLATAWLNGVKVAVMELFGGDVMRWAAGQD
jgi:hypothetical protein